MADTMPPAADRSEHPDYRARKLGPHEWALDQWSQMHGWETLPGTFRTKRLAIESTRPRSEFCFEHWSWLCSGQR